MSCTNLFYRLAFVLLLTACSSATSFAQTLKSFTPDPVKFIEEMESFLKEANEEEATLLMSEFVAIWNPQALSEKEQEKMFKEANKILEKRMKEYPGVKYTPYSAGSGRLNDSQKQAIYRTTNTMLKKRMKPSPDFKNYLYTLISFVNTNQTEMSFNAWQAGLDKLLLAPNKYFTSFINTCNSLFLENAIYMSVSTKWVSNSNNYSFDFDSLPKVVFPGLDLFCFSKNDTSIVYQTKGSFYPSKNLWRGEGGKVNWVRAGLEEGLVYAGLKNYLIEMNGSDWYADSVTFYHKAYFKEPLIGKLEDKLLANRTTTNASYPRFSSYNIHLRIKDIVKDVDYEGGFSLEGNKVIGSGNKEENAHLTYYREKKKFMTAGSQSFVINTEKISSSRAIVTIYHNTDSIYHPGVEFKYIVKNREVSLFRPEEGVGQSPFFDSYHKLDMHFDAVSWKIDDPLINMKMISGMGESKAKFESSNYYTENRFLKIQGISDVHPFIEIKNFADKYQTKEIYTEDLAKFMHLTPGELRVFLLSLANKGFLLYEPEEDRFVIKDRLYYYLNAAVGKVDYDLLQFQSLVGGKSNATLNLMNFDLTIQGVSHVMLSDSQDVYVIPLNQQLVLQKNRDFKFSGRVHAGYTDIYGKEFSFEYDNFKLNLNTIDSVLLKVPDKSQPQELNGKYPLVPVKSILENLTGDMQIDHPFNKSGVKSFPEYPIFNSKKDAFVFYNRIFGGVYTKDKFYFHLEPFTMDSLDNFDPAGLGYQGTFASSGIFPEFKEVLSIQRDFSLGFIRSTPANGFPAYGGKGTYTSTIKMSHEGLRGDGQLDYLSSTTRSNNFMYFPDSMNAVTQDFLLKKGILNGVEFPAVKAKEIYVHWEPYKDRMHGIKRETMMDFYEGQSQLDGNFQLAPKGLTGNGIMHLPQSSELEARLFKYKQNNFASDTADFRLAADTAAASGLAFSTKNVQAFIDFTNRVGEFKSNGGASYVTFPANQYMCYIDKVKWFMDKKEVELSASGAAAGAANADLDIEGPEFISIHPDQDSLRFHALAAKFSLSDFIIRAQKVKHIQVADASVIPNNGDVIIEKKAKMQTLNNAKIVANTTTKFHTIYDATVNISGRKKYEGSGKYDYIDMAKKKQTITFDKVSVDTSVQTYAIGEISDTSFTLSPYINYRGKAALTASKEFLNFNGAALLKYKCEGIGKSWFRISSDINPNDIVIPVSDPKDEEGNKITAAILHTTDSTRIYSAFLSRKNKYSDLEIVAAEGVLVYDKAANEYKISTKDKLENEKIPGNFLRFNDTKCMMYGEGKLNLGANFGQVKLNTVGNITNNLHNGHTQLDLLMALDFFFADNALSAMADDINTMQGLSGTVDTRPVYEKGIAELIGKEKADKVISEITLYGAFKKLPSDLHHTIFFSELNMQWSAETQSFLSFGPIGISNMDKTKINKQVKGQVEIQRKRSGDVLNIYIEMEGGNWYYFNYQRGIMQAISSNKSFNEAINNIKPEKRSSDGQKGDPPYQFMPSTERKKSDFLKKTSSSEEGEQK